MPWRLADLLTALSAEANLDHEAITALVHAGCDGQLSMQGGEKRMLVVLWEAGASPYLGEVP